MPLAGLLLLAPNPLLSQGASQVAREQLRADAQSKIKTLSGRFAEILSPTDRERQLRAGCSLNCGAVADAATGKTVDDELDDIAIAKGVELDQVSAEIQSLIDRYIVRTVRTSDPNLDSESVTKDLRQILQNAESQPPAAFVLRSPKSRTLLVFYNVLKGGNIGSSTVLSAYTAGATCLKLADSTGGDMDGYLNLEVKELHPPKANEIWLLVSGQMSGANGPNIRMRVVAYDGKKFRTVWMPANQWGEFTTRVTQDGFTVDGDYYQSSQHRHEGYFLAPDGLYLKRPAE
jgi:hypothetical protein